MAKQLDVLIAGAGLAGLTLAHRLVLAGARVRVCERDAEPFARTQGYRITVDRHGIDALRRSLPAPLFDAVLRTSGPPGGHFRFTNEHLRDAFVLSFAPGPDAERQIDRDLLRRVLLSTLGDRVEFGSEVRAVHDGEHGPEAELAGGDRRRADVLVVADGIGSTLSRTVFPDAVPVDTGRGGIYGRAPLSAVHLPDALLDSGFLALLPTAGSALFFTTMRFGADPATAVPDAPTREPYVMWGLVLPPGELRAAQADPVPDALLRRAHDAVLSAHPLLRSLIEHTEPDSVLLSRFSAGTRPGAAAVGNVVVLGDAIHPMPPFGAHGGNTALRDAAELGDRLVACDRDSIGDAVRDYHREMSGYAFDAVDAAMTQMNRLSTANPLQRWVLRRLLPAVHRRTVPA